MPKEDDIQLMPPCIRSRISYLFWAYLGHLSILDPPKSAPDLFFFCQTPVLHGIQIPKNPDLRVRSMVHEVLQEHMDSWSCPKLPINATHYTQIMIPFVCSISSSRVSVAAWSRPARTTLGVRLAPLQPRPRPRRRTLPPPRSDARLHCPSAMVAVAMVAQDTRHTGCAGLLAPTPASCAPALVVVAPAMVALALQFCTRSHNRTWPSVVRKSKRMNSLTCGPRASVRQLVGCCWATIGWLLGLPSRCTLELSQTLFSTIIGSRIQVGAATR